jgi:uncharacterized membrane protein (UPF0182 family)
VNGGRRFPTLLVTAFALVVGGPWLAGFYADWLWFGETGYQAVFLRSLSAQGTLGLTVMGVALAWLFLNLRPALKRITRRAWVVNTPEGPRSVAVEAGSMRVIGYALAAVAAGLVATVAATQWESWLFFRHATAFGVRDPILGRDVGFYVFKLPFLQLVQGLMMTAVVMGAIGAAAAYAVTGMFGIGGRGPFLRGAVQTHFALLAAAFFAVLAFGAWLRIPALLIQSSGIIHGASYADVHARLPALRVLMAAAVAAAVLCVVAALRGRLRLIAAAAGLYGAALLGGEIYASLLQRFVVAPNEQAKETPYLLHNIEGTRAAFALQAVAEREFSGDRVLTGADIAANAATLKNVPLWDHRPLLDTFGQLQEIRTYYDYVSVDNDRYTINGEYRQIMLSARELNSESLPNRSWINERLTFTHGYGVTLGPVNQVTPEGLPVLFIKNLPPESSVDLEVAEPSIYFGELSNDHVFVRTRTKEFHYPQGEDNVFTTYAGEGGVPLGGFLRKLLFSVKFRSLKTLLTDDLTGESRVLFHRRIAERVSRIAPFLRYDPDPYLAIVDGRLLWVQDAYTTSDRYPYSQPTSGGLNYIRNSVKATVDAYHGRTTFYLVDPADPVAATLARIFPGLLRPLAEMPEGLRSRLRYPRTIFALQAAMFSTYHMRNPAVFYNKEDQWEVPSLETAGRSERMEPYYTIMKLPGEARPEFIAMLPFTPRQKDNLAAWMVARSDGEQYGRLAVFQFPKQKVVYGPRQVVSRINQDQVISPQITLWNQQGSEVIQGTLLVIPIEESLLYIRPLYLRSAGGRIPELKRVIVAYQNQIVMEESLDAAIARIFRDPARAEAPAAAAPAGARPAVPAGAEAGAPVPGESVDALAARAREHYQRALQAQREGDWARYGEEIRRLGDVLDQMGKRR